jgi:lipid II:glycine glycyltransferase (peptidoglycan interpeptide bridge formation enzyme)
LYKQALCRRGTLGFVKVPFKTILVDLTPDIDEILASFSANTRNEIRRAEKLGIVTCPAMPAEFLGFYNRFADHRGIAGVSHDELQAYSQNLLILKAEFQGEPLVMRACLCDADGKRARDLKSGSTRLENGDHDHKKLVGFANRLLHWRLIQEFKSHGFAEYDLGGYEDPEADPALAGIHRFKAGFGGNIVIENDYASMALYLKEIALRSLQRKTAEAAPAPSPHA